MYTSINKKALLAIFVFCIPLIVFASNFYSNTSVLVFENSSNFYYVPVQSFESNNGYIKYVDITGQEHQFLLKYLSLIYSDNSKGFLNSIAQNIFSNGKLEVKFQNKFPDKKSKSYQISLYGIDYKINYNENNDVIINFKVDKAGKYIIELAGLVKDTDFTGFKARVDENTISNIFSNNLFYFLNEKTFGNLVTKTASGINATTYLKSGSNTITLHPVINSSYLYIKDIKVIKVNK